MERKQLTLIAAICGAVTFLGVLMPWGVISTDLGPLGTRSHSWNGTEAPFQGGFVLVLGLAGGAAALLVFLGKTSLIKLDEQKHYFIAIGCFGLGLLLTFIDFVSDYGTHSVMGITAYEVDRGIGVFLTLLACAGGGVASFLALKKGAGSVSTEPE